MRCGWVLLLVGCAGASPGEGPTVSGAETESATEASDPGALGMTLLEPVERVRAARPSLDFSTGEEGVVVARGAVRYQGRNFDVHLTFYEGLLARISAHAEPVTVEDFERLADAVEARNGHGEPSICASEVGPPLAAYLASGRGSLRREWSGDARGSVTLQPLTAGELQLGLYLEQARLAARHREPLDLKGSGSKQSMCPELGASPPRIEGLVFGRSPDQVRADLGTDADLSGYDNAQPRRLFGVDGTLRLGFYDGCLAVVTFEAPGTLATYAALQAGLLREMGPVERRERCTPDGEAPTEQDLAAGRVSLQTLWQEGPLAGSVVLRRDHQAASPVVRVEVRATALRDRAPHIDFTE